MDTLLAAIGVVGLVAGLLAVLAVAADRLETGIEEGR